jgi:hypothetical protein
MTVFLACTSAGCMENPTNPTMNSRAITKLNLFFVIILFPLSFELEVYG